MVRLAIVRSEGRDWKEPSGKAALLRSKIKEAKQCDAKHRSSLEVLLSNVLFLRQKRAELFKYAVSEAGATEEGGGGHSLFAG